MTTAMWSLAASALAAWSLANMSDPDAAWREKLAFGLAAVWFIAALVFGLVPA